MRLIASLESQQYMSQKFRTNQLILSGQDVNSVFYPLSSNPSSFINTGQTGNFVATGTNSIINDNSNSPSINIQNRQLIDSVNSQSLDWGNRILKDGFQNYSIQYDARFLRDAAQDYVLDWNNLILSGNWTAQALSISGSSVVLASQTGGFGGGGSGGSFNTGTLVGTFALLNSNNNFSGTETIYNTNSINLITTTGNYTGYQQINVQNQSSSPLASSDLVVTNDIGNESNYYVDLGINSSTYTGQFVGNTGDGYLFSQANDFYIGNTQSGNKLYLFAGTTPFTGSQAGLTIFNNNLGINNNTPIYDLDVSGNTRILISNLTTQSISGGIMTGIGLLLGNPVLATSVAGLGVQVSPSLNFSGNYYATGSGTSGSFPYQWRIYATGISGIVGNGQGATQLNFGFTTGNETFFEGVSTAIFFSTNGSNNQGTINAFIGKFLSSVITPTCAVTTLNPNGGNSIFINNTNNSSANISNSFTPVIVNPTVINTGNLYLNAFSGNYTSAGGNATYTNVVVAPNYNFTGPQSGTIYDLRVNSTSPNLSGANHILFDVSNSGTSWLKVTNGLVTIPQLSCTTINPVGNVDASAVLTNSLNANGVSPISFNTATNTGNWTTHNIFTNETNNFVSGLHINYIGTSFSGNNISTTGGSNYTTVLVNPNWNFTGPQTGTVYDLRVNSTSPQISGATHYLFDVSNSGTSYFNISGNGSGNFPSGLIVNNSPVLTNSFYRAGTVAVGSNATTQLVTFSSNFANTGYSVSLTPDNAMGTANTLAATSKTISGFTISATLGVVGGFNVDYTAMLYN